MTRQANASARLVAARTLLRAVRDDAYVDRAFRSEAAGLAPRDHGLARALAYAAVQRRDTLAYWITTLSGRPAASLDDEVRIPLELGLVQLGLMDRIPPHAAVSESVDIAKRLSNRGGDRLVNAVLRRAAAEGLPALPGDDTPQAAAITYSVPQWLAERWFEEYGPQEARLLLARINEPAERAIRVNTLRATVDEVRAELGVPAHGDDELPHALVLDEALDLETTELWERGAIVAQARGAQLAAHLLAPKAGEQVLDLCAAPGGKTSHLAALMGGGDGLMAVESHRGRAAALRRTLDRLGAGAATVVTGDALAPPPAFHGRFDAILLDPPCAALGTLQRQPDVRWRATPERIDELAAGQRRMLAAALPLLAPGGRLLYSVCSLGPAESDDVIAAVGATPSMRRSVLPHRDLTDGFEYAQIDG
jgi:16S rRNA (cytosine967-C5)-methyltransferase